MRFPEMTSRTLLPLAALLTVLLVGCSRSAQPVRPHVVFVVFDTTRVDHLSSFGYERETTPELEKWLARDSVRFDRMVAATNNTSCAHATMFTGLHVKSHGLAMLATKGNGLRTDVPTLAEVLHAQGYLTMAAVSVFHLNPDTSGLGRGFDTFVEAPFDPTRLKRPGEETNAALFAALDDKARRGKIQEPLFLFVHYFDPHHSYKPLPRHLALFPAEQYHDLPVPYQPEGFLFHDEQQDVEVEVARQTAMYDAEVRRADEALGALFQKLQDLGVMENAVVVFTADHGENLGEHDLFASHSGLYREVIHTPLMIRVPGVTRRSTSAAMVHQTDLMPTVLEAAGVPRENWPPLEGKSLFPLLRGGTEKLHDEVYSESAMFREKAILTDRYKLVFEDANQKTLLFDLEEDPSETRNLAFELPEVREELLQKLTDFAGTRTYALQQTTPTDSRRPESVHGRLRSHRPLELSPVNLEEGDRLDEPRAAGEGREFAFTVQPGRSKGLSIEAPYGPVILDIVSDLTPVPNEPVWLGDRPRLAWKLPIVVSPSDPLPFREMKAETRDAVAVHVQILQNTAEKTDYRLTFRTPPGKVTRGVLIRMDTDGQLRDFRAEKPGNLGYKGLGGGNRCKVGARRIAADESFTFSIIPGNRYLFLESKSADRMLPNTAFRIGDLDDPRAYPSSFLLAPTVMMPRIDADSLVSYLEKPGFHLWSEQKAMFIDPDALDPETRKALEELGYIGGDDGRGDH